MTTQIATKEQVFNVAQKLANGVSYHLSPLNQRKQFSCDQVRVALNREYKGTFSGSSISQILEKFCTKSTVQGYYNFSEFKID